MNQLWWWDVALLIVLVGVIAEPTVRRWLKRRRERRKATEELVKFLADTVEKGVEVIGPTIDALSKNPATTHKAQLLLNLASQYYYLLELAMFANKEVNAYVTLAAWKKAGLEFTGDELSDPGELEKEMSEIEKGIKEHRIVNASSLQGHGSGAQPSPASDEQWPRAWRTLFCVVMFFASLVAAIMLWKAIGGKHPYAFYTALRWFCFGVFFCSAIATFRVMREYDEIWYLPAIFGALLGALAVLFNPFSEFHFNRDTWRVIDIVSFVCVLLLILAFYGRFGEELPTQIKRAAKLIIWFIAAGLVVSYAADEGVRLYGKYALATATTTGTVFEVDEEDVESETGQSGVRYTGVYRFQVDGKTYSGRTDHHDEVGDSLLVRYNPANPEHNRDAIGNLFDETYGLVGFAVIVCGLYWWLKWILGRDKANGGTERK